METATKSVNQTIIYTNNAEKWLSRHLQPSAGQERLLLWNGEDFDWLFVMRARGSFTYGILVARPISCSASVWKNLPATSALQGSQPQINYRLKKLGWAYLRVMRCITTAPIVKQQTSMLAIPVKEIQLEPNNMCWLSGSKIVAGEVPSR